MLLKDRRRLLQRKGLLQPLYHSDALTSCPSKPEPIEGNVCSSHPPLPMHLYLIFKICVGSFTIRTLFNSSSVVSLL